MKLCFMQPVQELDTSYKYLAIKIGLGFFLVLFMTAKMELMEELKES